MSSTPRRRVLVVFGTRPEAIKMAPVVRALKAEPSLETVVCVTAQHRSMLDQVLDLFAIVPDIDLDLMKNRQTVADLTGSVLHGITQVLETARPDLALVHGDTTTAFATTLACFYQQVSVGHVEAGLRTHDLRAPWPEEFNRRAVDIIADRLWAPTQGAADALLREGVDPRNILVTGNTVIDALNLACASLDADPRRAGAIAAELPPPSPDRKMLLVTGHRRESFDGGLADICRALNVLAMRKDVEVVWPVHRNPAVLETVEKILRPAKNVHLLEPTDYLTFVELMRRSHLIITDSGGIQEEAPTLSKPVLITREETERPEVVTAGAARLVGTKQESIVREAERLLDDAAAYRRMAEVDNPFGDGRAAERIAASIVDSSWVARAQP
jgi:UDP-N-acetylglucosamine 2-epimerase (non-hydrolysing)